MAALGASAIYASNTAAQDAGAGSHAGMDMGKGTATTSDPAAVPPHRAAHGSMITVGTVDNARNGFDPTSMLTDWYTGELSDLPDGGKLRSFEITVEEKEIEIAPGVMFPAWTYNGRVPGPALRATEGERLKIKLVNNGSHPHSLHFHGIHAARMDGVPGAGVIGPGEEFVYEFTAKPFGCHLYHCHALPLARHIHKGMYGLFVIDPDPARHPDHLEVAKSRLLGSPENARWQEMAMVMNAFDTNFDGENEFYACNTIAHCYAKEPIKLVKGRPVRVYLVNIVEFDPINSFHLHANFFDYYDQGTTLTPTLKTVDLIVQCQAQRGILEFTFRGTRAGALHVPRASIGIHRTWLDGHVRRSGGAVMIHEKINAAAPASGFSRYLWLLMPVAVLAVAVVWLLQTNPLQGFNNGAPPVENLTIERTILDSNGLRVLVRAGGSDPMVVAQVQVDAGYWEFQQEPAGAIERGDTAWISIPYPWVLGETHNMTFVTNTGTTFDHQIAVAVPTPVATFGSLWAQAILGAFVGILPVAIGLMCYPALRGAGQGTMTFLLALTVGLLTFLLVDTFVEALEFANASAPIFQGSVMVVLTAAASFLVLMAVGRRRGTPTGLALATFIALGIGLHNFGEGLAIGAAFAAGSAGLGTFLVLGFTLHNITEGIGIAAPILKVKPSLLSFVGLALLAGGPAVIGIWAGSLAYAPQWTAIALAVGAGAIAQVIVEVCGLMSRSNGQGIRSLVAPASFGGLAAGVAFMYITAMLVKI